MRAARALLSAVTRLLILADMADVYKLLVQLKVVSVGLCCAWHAGAALPRAHRVCETLWGVHWQQLPSAVGRVWGFLLSAECVQWVCVTHFHTHCQ